MSSIISSEETGKPLNGRIEVTAHSGCMNLPDNSLEAMKAGIEAGASIVEFDLSYTQDGEPVLSHDTPVKGESYVTLEEAFAFLSECPGIYANVDVKDTKYLEKVPVLAANAKITDRIFFTGIGENDVAAVRGKCPGIPYYLNTAVKEDDDYSALAEKVAGLGAVGLNIDWKYSSPELVSAFHEKGLPVSVWTVNDGEAAKQLAAYGVDNITSRRPDTVCGVIK